jgi:hypothetical protein
MTRSTRLFLIASGLLFVAFLRLEANLTEQLCDIDAWAMANEFAENLMHHFLLGSMTSEAHCLFHQTIIIDPNPD